MTTLFKKLFIKNYKDVENPTVRSAYGKASGTLGILGNAFLFAIKLIAGILSGSVAVVADAINNLTDFMTSIITLIGFKISGKSADKEHPFGHARFEYVTTLLVACVIFFIGIETGRSAIDKIFSSQTTNFSLITCIILGVSILVKICLSVIFNGLGKAVNSDAIKAMSADSRNDAISTTAVFACAVIGIFTNLQLDGYLGILVSILVIISAISLIKDTIDPLLGEKPNAELFNKIKSLILSHKGVLDVHELIVHSYGPTQFFATVHIEVDSKVDVMISHELADEIERDCLKKLNVNLVCHLDPINLSDPETVKLTHTISQFLKENHPRASFHDLRIVKGPTFTNVIFDLVLPFDKSNEQDEIKKSIDELLEKEENKYYAVIEFENSFDD
ncbi:MAG: cation transporter [Clostridia bacterium]|nr:cation transporter [Clostridia bacterium]